MTFTIASAAREALAEVVQTRIRREKEEDDRKTREYEEVRFGYESDDQSRRERGQKRSERIG